jgi:hypothetical protein
MTPLRKEHLVNTLKTIPQKLFNPQDLTITNKKGHSILSDYPIYADKNEDLRLENLPITVFTKFNKTQLIELGKLLEKERTPTPFITKAIDLKQKLETQGK